jgi:hypothetical protein
MFFGMVAAPQNKRAKKKDFRWPINCFAPANKTALQYKIHVLSVAKSVHQRLLWTNDRKLKMCSLLTPFTEGVNKFVLGFNYFMRFFVSFKSDNDVFFSKQIKFILSCINITYSCCTQIVEDTKRLPNQKIAFQHISASRFTLTLTCGWCTTTSPSSSCRRRLTSRQTGTSGPSATPQRNRTLETW